MQYNNNTQQLAHSLTHQPSYHPQHPMLNLPEPPNSTSLSIARQKLDEQLASISALKFRIDQAELDLSCLISQHERDISALKAEQAVMEKDLLHTQAYVAPIRRLPSELLGEVFTRAWQDHACVAWVLASVSRGWRQTALAMPRIWSKVSHKIHNSSLYPHDPFRFDSQHHPTLLQTLSGYGCPEPEIPSHWISTFTSKPLKRNLPRHLP